MSSQTSILGQPCGHLGYGIMRLTWHSNPPAFEDSIPVMKRALELGADNWNGGEFYGPPDRNSLHLLKAYLSKYPDDASGIILNIKGGAKKGELAPDGSEANTRRSLDECLALIADTPKPVIDIFECARVDPKIGNNHAALRVMAEYVKAGKIRGIGLSEVGAKTIRNSQKMLIEDLGIKQGLASVEIELSLWTPDTLQNGIMAVCAELGIPIFAYSPLARGALSDKPIRSNSEIPDGDFRKHLPKFQDDTLKINNQITDAVGDIAKKRGATTAQIAIAWIAGLSRRKHTVVLEDGSKKEVTLPTIIPIPGASSVARVEENFEDVKLSEDEMKELDALVDNFPTQGERYPAAFNAMTNG